MEIPSTSARGTWWSGSRTYTDQCQRPTLALNKMDVCVTTLLVLTLMYAAP
jgi:hypothetical protein